METKWISVKDELPEPHKHMIMFSPEKNVHIGTRVTFFKGDEFYYNAYNLDDPIYCPSAEESEDNVTHWMPLPEAPKDE